MQSEQQQEYNRLTEAANETLNSVAESGTFLHVFSFWRLPAFEDHVRTTLYTPRRPDSGKDPFVSITTWKREDDFNKLRDPVERLKHPKELKPTIDEASKILDPEDASKVIEDLSAISLTSLRPTEGVLGLDGVGYRFSFSQGYFSLDLSWWCDRPKVWQEATSRIEDVVSRLHRAKPKLAEQDGAGQPATRSESK
ncbi:hypothetical protein [Haloferula sargassicola]|uniref:Transcriptional regulator n=1 Tax=Haloferula sargassicola TaxID=490096 RepID=A0ABP9UYA5_9BACT